MKITIRIALSSTLLLAIAGCDPFDSAAVKHDLGSCRAVASSLDAAQSQQITDAIQPVIVKDGLLRQDCGSERTADDKGRYIACYGAMKGKGRYSFDVAVIEFDRPEHLEIVLWGWTNQIKQHSGETLGEFSEALRPVFTGWSCT